MERLTERDPTQVLDEGAVRLLQHLASETTFRVHGLPILLTLGR
jgi:hypothetical protein